MTKTKTTTDGGDVLPGGADTPEQEMIPVPAQVKYGICIFETTDDLAEPILHVHAPDEYARISVSHLTKLLYTALKNLEAEVIWAKFAEKAKSATAGRILKP